MNRSSLALRGLSLVVVGALGIAGAAPSLAAEEMEQIRSLGFDATYQVGDQQGVGVDDGGFAPISYAVRESPYADGSGTRPVGTGWGGVEFKAFYEHRWVIPALRWGSGKLFADNNISVRSRTGVSPISATQEIRITATPVAFLNAYAGASIGTGWNVQVFDGLGEVDPDTGEIDDASFPGAVVRAFTGGTLQFDLAAVFPGEWNHVVTVVSPQFTYSALSSAGSAAAWSFENDEGTNYNGWTRHLTAVLGYQPPFPIVGTVDVLFESEQLVGSAVDRAEESASGHGGKLLGFLSGGRTVPNASIARREPPEHRGPSLKKNRNFFPTGKIL
ncbi:MAG: hypothetical protein WD492_10940 [Alkalispirochaeta sp.]